MYIYFLHSLLLLQFAGVHREKGVTLVSIKRRYQLSHAKDIDRYKVRTSHT